MMGVRSFDFSVWSKRVSPAMEAGVTEHLWNLAELLAV